MHRLNAPSLRMRALAAVLFFLCQSALQASQTPQNRTLDEALKAAGPNGIEIEKALSNVPSSEKAGMQFLVVNMSDKDLQTLAADYLLGDCNQAYDALTASPWKKEIPENIFENEILPYSCLNEKRDDFRKTLRPIALEIIKGCKTPSSAALALNSKLFGKVNVHYSTARQKPDQAPQESMASGLASCTGLSILLVDACRSVGIPARVAGIPLWTTELGNHTWVEIWDGGWHYLGASEPDPAGLDHAWFTDDAAAARADEPNTPFTHRVSREHRPISRSFGTFKIRPARRSMSRAAISPKSRQIPITPV